MAMVNSPSRNRWTAVILAAWVIAASLMLWLAGDAVPARAHGESIQVTPSEAHPGEEITVTGEDFPPGEEVQLSLEGVRGNTSLGHAEADDSEAFSATVVIPEGVSAGSYQLVAATEDDHLTLDFSVLEGASTDGGDGGTTVVYQRGTGELIAIALIAVVLILGGVALVATGRKGHPSR